MNPRALHSRSAVPFHKGGPEALRALRCRRRREFLDRGVAFRDRVWRIDWHRLENTGGWSVASDIPATPGFLAIVSRSWVSSRRAVVAAADPPYQLARRTERRCLPYRASHCEESRPCQNYRECCWVARMHRWPVSGTEGTMVGFILSDPTPTGDGEKCSEARRWRSGGEPAAFLRFAGI